VGRPRSRSLAGSLLGFYDRQRRDLPWRQQPSAYRTLVSELMLQQTVVATVIPYFQRFMARFPELATLAAASEAEVLALWSGLGYYARGRNLHRLARVVVAEHGGRLPETEEALRALPGIGPYTAAAIAAIAFGQRALALDGNVARVLARLFAVREAIDRPAVRDELRERGRALVPAQRAGDFAQALMELGALVCVPANPRCPVCPVRPWCRAAAEGITGELPVRLPRRPKQQVRLACAAVVRRGRVLLVQRPDDGLLAGTWALPAAEVPGGVDPRARATEPLIPLGLPVAGARVIELGSIRHVFTHRDVTAHVFRVDLEGGGSAPGGRWVPVEGDAALAISSFTRKTLSLLVAGAAGDQRRARIASPSTR
jgi:A/G-specific adenine glycosylase